MLLFRLAVFVLTFAAIVAFALYVGTGQERFKTHGLRLLKWAVLAGLGFFGLLALERLI